MARRKKKKNTAAAWLVLLFLIIAGAGYASNKTDVKKVAQETATKVVKQVEPKQATEEKTSTQAKVDLSSNINDKYPNKELASSVLTDNVKNQLGNSIEYNNAGSFVINQNKNDLDASVSSAPYVNLSPLDNLSRPGVANALLSKSTRQYEKRNNTYSDNGVKNDATINPVGWHQLKLIDGHYHTLYNRGHLIAYSLAGKVRGFDASMANYQNIVAQTAWANQASNGNPENKGQNYYETLVRKALDRNKRVRYRVTPIYDGNNLVPSGIHIEAKANDGSLEYNVFVPNVEMGVTINYATGFAKIN